MRKNLFKTYLALVCLLFVTATSWADDFSTTYSYGLSNWSLTNYDDESSYYRVPSGNVPSVATFSGIFLGKTITSDVVVTINCATYGSGTNPSASTFSLYKETACTNPITASQGGTLPTTSTYMDVTYTVTQANAASLNGDLAIKITKPGSTIRLKSIKIEFTYTNPKPTHTARFSIDGIIDAANDHTVEEGLAITFPIDPQLDGVTFMGWTTASIAGTLDVAPTMVNMATEVMGTNDVTYYAVFAGKKWPSSDSSTLAGEDIALNLTSKALGYSYDPRSHNDGKINWTVKGLAPKGATYIQIRKNEILSYIMIEAPSAITSVAFDVADANGSNFNGNIFLTTAPTADPGNDENVKGTTPVSGTNGEISSISDENSTLYIQSNNAAQLSNIVVTYNVFEYSDYCTIVGDVVSISSVGYTTYYNSTAAYTMPADCEGYVFTAANGLGLAYEAGAVVPAGEPLIIHTTAPGSKTLLFTTSAEQTYKEKGGNDLDGTDEQTALADDANYYFYGLTMGKGDLAGKVGFFWMNATGAAFTNGAHKAYLKLPKGGSIKGFTFEDLQTAINALESNTPKLIFDLQGRKINAARKGIFIVNGKKVVK